MSSIKHVLSILLCFVFCSFTFASDDHDHESEKNKSLKGEDHKNGVGKESGKHEDHDNDSHDEDDELHDHDEEIVQSKTILEIKKNGKKFKLSKKTIETLKIKYAPCKTVGDLELKVSKASLVTFERKMGVFIHASDWFELIEVDLISQKDSQYTVKTKNFPINATACEIVISGVPLLRVAQLEASGEGGQGHGH